MGHTIERQAQPTAPFEFRWWMPGILIITITIAAGLFLTAARAITGAAWFEVGSSGWWVLTSVLHLPFFGILLFLIIGIGERLGFYWKGRAPEQPGKMPAVYPTVCVQLPMFNEHTVARRVIEAVANMQWPADRFSIQALDDSTDEGARRLVEQVSAEIRARGIDCRVLHRTDRHGYKAGALEAGRRQTEAEFLVIFDADFVPPVDFLLRTIPHFYQQDGQPDTDLALVQAQWGHLNHNQSALTLAQSLWVDDHHTLQMAWRSAAWKFVNFTGTAGVWRASAIEAAGGWRLARRQPGRGWRTKFPRSLRRLSHQVRQRDCRARGAAGHLHRLQSPAETVDARLGASPTAAPAHIAFRLFHTVAAAVTATLSNVRLVAVAVVGSLDAGAAVCHHHRPLAWRPQPLVGRGRLSYTQRSLADGIRDYYRAGDQTYLRRTAHPEELFGPFWTGVSIGRPRRRHAGAPGQRLR